MPKEKEYEELVDNCTIENYELAGKYGYLFTSKINGNSIFFPALYSPEGSEFDIVKCWCKDRYINKFVHWANILDYRKSHITNTNSIDRNTLLPIRAIEE